MDTTCCPECGEIAEVRERSVLESTDGPIEHAKIVCVERHWFLMPVSYLHSSPAPGGALPPVTGPPPRGGCDDRGGPAARAPAR